MKQMFSIIMWVLVVMPTCLSQESTDIADLFKIKCAICHTIGGGKLIGPDLSGVDQRHSRDWLVEFVRSSQKMINRGDPAAVALFEANNKIQMPDPMISDDQIQSILDHIEAQSGQAASGSEYVSILEGASPENRESGRRLFEGLHSFSNGGPSCLSCHNDISTYFFSENSYSNKDIRTSFSTLGEAGIKAILESPPFPVMRKAFEGRPLQEAEIHDLLVFLRDSGSANAHANPSSGYLLYGLGGTVLLLFLIAGLWIERKRTSVNHKIYKRQIRSAN
ncbi:MAG: cytochrome c [Saprospiraceae bacterium]|nr:cytochrome c [Saprospiraceae bacterium]